jgi:hypothetical protein
MLSSSPRFLVEKEKIRIDQKDGNEIFPEAFPLLDALITNINALLFQEVKEFLIIHAGAVKKEGGSFCFPVSPAPAKAPPPLCSPSRLGVFGDDWFLSTLKVKKFIPIPFL